MSKYSYEIWNDDDPMSVWEWEEEVSFTTNVPRYLSDHNEGKHYDLPELMDLAKDNKIVMIPVWAYIHSGITIRESSFSDPWDSGLGGILFLTRDQVLKIYGGKRLTKGRRERALSLLRGVLKEWDAELTGDVWGYDILKNGEVIDSCGGFYGEDAAIKEAESNINFFEKRDQERKAKKQKAYAIRLQAYAPGF